MTGHIVFIDFGYKINTFSAEFIMNISFGRIAYFFINISVNDANLVICLTVQKSSKINDIYFITNLQTKYCYLLGIDSFDNSL